MKIGDNIKKVFNSFDFRGNRIKNLRVDTPEELSNYTDSDYNEKKDFVANKEYVDKKTTYDTQLSDRFKIPFHSWFERINVNGLSYKELLDKILFPRIKPTYINPEVESVEIKVYNQVQLSGKYIVWEDQEIRFDVTVKIKSSDRESLVVGKLQVLDKETNKELFGFNSLTTSDNECKFECRYIWKPNQKLVFSKEYTKSVTKSDTHGNVVPNTLLYILREDITDAVNKQCIVLTSILTAKKLTFDSFPDSSIDSYTISNRCIFGATELGAFDIALPKAWDPGEFLLRYIMIDQSTREVFGTGIIEKHNLLDETDNLRSENSKLNAENWVAYKYNFGVTGKNTEVYLYPLFPRNLI